ncbi:desulfoferrodoxin family protein [Anaerospora sp.]|uniref:desulfoferrodoxin family protein n=1 Tax=Anaerospora sp. TaxID=1960278 RepID=UPI00289C131C|nr:desulfoferrodoxin family protein [Anaerospora sp.]
MVFYQCEHCGNIAGLITDNGGKLTCCDKQMAILEANVTEASEEKHIPVAVKEDNTLQVSVGASPHKMLPEHYTYWVAVATDNRDEFVYLKPGMEPVATFPYTGKGTVYAYCNIHGLWKSEV